MEQALSHRQFFHGTDAKLQPGDLIHPNYKGDIGHNTEHPEHSDFVWMSNRLRDADWYARRRSQVKKTDPPGHVYQVEPTGLHGPADLDQPGPKTKSNTAHVSLAPARVIREVPHDERAAADPNASRRRGR